MSISYSSSFDEGFYAFNGESELTCPEGWRPAWKWDPQEGRLDRPEYKPKDRDAGQPEVRTGRYAAGFYTSHATHNACLFRTFAVGSGSRISAKVWCMGVTHDDHDTPSAVDAGGGLARIDNDLYAIPGGGAAELWRYDPVGIYRERLRLDHVAIVVPETATQGSWYNLPLDDVPPDFALVGGDNIWVGGSATVWEPDPTVPPNDRLI